MVALKQEIINRLDQLDEAQQLRVLELIDELQQPQQQTLGDVLDRAAALNEKLRQKYGERFIPSVQDLVDEVREERLNDLMGRD